MVRGKYREFQTRGLKWFVESSLRDALSLSGALSTDLMFDLIGPRKIRLYRSKPSGRFRIFGIVKVRQTDHV